MPVALVIDNGVSELRDLPDYDALNGAVGGYVQYLQLTPEVHAYIHEEGKLIGLPYNHKASQLCDRLDIGLMPGDVIAGAMVCFGSLNEEGEVDGADYDIPASFVSQVTK